MPERPFKFESRFALTVTLSHAWHLAGFSKASNQLPESPVSHGSSSQVPQCLGNAVRRGANVLLSSAFVAICSSLQGEGVMREED